MGPGDNRQASSARGLAHPRREDAASQQRQRPVRMGLVLQLSRFPWGEDAAGPARWLAAVAHAAAEAGLQGIALMDHLIQIPQIGSAREPIPEQWVTVRVGRCRLQRGRPGKRPVDPDPDVP